MQRFSTFLFHGIEKIFIPYRCILCLEASDQRRDLCRQCQNTLPVLSHSCEQCGIVLSDKTQKCGQCIHCSPYFDNTEVIFDYTMPVAHWLKQFKFHKKGLYARILCEIFVEQLRQKINEYPEKKPQLLLPVPLHWKRLVGRGFNQTQIIAQHISQQLQIPIIKNHLVKRLKSTFPQSSLNQHNRRQNLKNAFSLKNPLKFQHIAIVDDIMTTGNTANELAKILKKNGVARVSVWILARAMR